MWLGSFRCNCTSGQLKKRGGGGELHEKKKKKKLKQKEGEGEKKFIKKKKKRSQNKMEIGKEIIWESVNKHLLKSLAHEILLRHEK